MSILKDLGFDKWFQDNIDSDALNGLEIARVIAVHKDSYTVTNGTKNVFSELVGKILFSATSPLDYPTVGDWVYAKFYDENTLSIIHGIIQRKSLLKRKTPGKKIDFQLIAANIDVAFIVQALDDDFNLRRLERYLVMVYESNITPIVLLSKSDLLASEVVLEKVREKDSKGRHATTQRQLIKLKNGAMVIDTPGMRELGNFSVDAGIDETFDEILELTEQCQFNDCTHSVEKGCAVLSAIESGRLSEKRYQNYMKMNKESVFNEMSYHQKRHKDKQFGKMCRTIMKHKKNRR